MAINLEDFQEIYSELPTDAQDVLRASWNEAARMFSSRGLDNYLKGGVALHHLGRGEELVVTYIQEMPEVARAIGEDVLPDMVNFLLGMASKTSGQVLALIAGTAPLAAQRLGDPDLFRHYRPCLGGSPSSVTARLVLFLMRCQRSRKHPACILRTSISPRLTSM